MIAHAQPFITFHAAPSVTFHAAPEMTVGGRGGAPALRLRSGVARVRGRTWAAPSPNAFSPRARPLPPDPHPSAKKIAPILTLFDVGRGGGG